MKKIRFCKKCLYSDQHPFGIYIDDEGICSGCRVHEEKDILDWEMRLEQLRSLVNSYRSNTGYDCIVPVTPANDSYFILHTVVKTLDLTPLVVTYNRYWNTKEGIKSLSNLRRTFNVDILIKNVNMESVKKITKTTLVEYGNINWHCIAGQTVFPVQCSVKYKIPLIIWGAIQGIEQVGMFRHTDNVEMTRRYRKDHDLFGVEAENLISIFNELSEEDIFEYIYPTRNELLKHGTRGIYLGNYIRWDPYAQHTMMNEMYGYQKVNFLRTFDKYDYIDCQNYMGVHDWLKLLKHGYSKVTDQACREIRHGRMTREYAISIVKKYENIKPSISESLCKWLGIDKYSLEWVINKHRNREYSINKGHNIWDEYTLCDRLCKDKKFQSLGTDNTGHLIPNEEPYIIIGKGYP